MSKQFFSNNYDINYNDYLKYKKGKEGIKKLISDKKYYVNSFINYETFLILSKAYYTQLNNKYDISPPVSISDSDTSYKCYKSVESHLKECSYCCSCKSVPKIFNCKEIQNILYPYGESIIKRDDLDGMYYPHKLKLNNYCCKKCDKNEDNCKSCITKSNIYNIVNKNETLYCSCGCSSRFKPLCPIKETSYNKCSICKTSFEKKCFTFQCRCESKCNKCYTL